MKILLLTLLSSAISVGIIIHTMSKNNSVTPPVIAIKVITPPEHRRPPDQTFLTYPEWFLVYSPEEFATYTKNNPAHRFPFFGHLGQFWSAYLAVYQEIKKTYAFNFGYHVMVMVIGGSTTVEYALRSCYENVVGRLSWATTGNEFSDEDNYAAKVARDYVDFIKVQPWYEFDFSKRLKGLWSENPAVGKHFFRKWERRYVLSMDYGVKTVYSWIIKKATQASYEQPITATAIVLNREFSLDTQRYPLATAPDKFNASLILVPRYDAFKDYAQQLANDGYDFKEISGNSGQVMLTYQVPQAWTNPSPNGLILFSQKILTHPDLKRIAIVLPVPELAALLRTPMPGAMLEHIYDF